MHSKPKISNDKNQTKYMPIEYDNIKKELH